MEEIKSPPLTCPNTVTVRRNPHRKARPTPSTAAPTSPSKNLPQISTFPIDDILSIQIPPNPRSDLSRTSSSSENLNVFLRIRPFLPAKSGVHTSKSRTKNAWPKNPAKKTTVKEKNANTKSNEACITVDDSQSVTLSPPLALQVSKRIKSEVYQGFSYVFSGDSSQGEVYEKMLNPLVEEFLRGKSGMLAALGPSGSGKTHTIFGSPRDPGMVPLALQKIFKGTANSRSLSRRSFYLSIFEICSERGKGERMLDLSPDGGDLHMQQSTIKGLQEVIVSEAAEAEFLIARAMLRRATAMTNANSQSSRSQCIINIRGTASEPDGKDEVPTKDAVLTIVDLAGAEREKRTGNQGSRLLESNFINNTSMVFGLCLRSLLEYQKNPKKPLQKHFQNSLLTRYLRDYLEGKKRMTLILTVKPGEEDYLDTSYLLRQASPYMKIKFDNVEDSSNLVSNKRHLQTSSRIEQSKRMKLSGVEACSKEERKSIGEDCTPGKLNPVELAKKERNHQITQNFAKALWNVLKQYNEKLKVAESEMKTLREKLSGEKKRKEDLEKELKDLKSCCNCSREGSEAVTSSTKTNTDFESRKESEGKKFSEVDEVNLDVNSLHLRTPECASTPSKCDATQEHNKDTLPQINVESDSSILKTSEQNSTPNNYGIISRQDQVVLSQTNLDMYSRHLWASECGSTPHNSDTTAEHKKDKLSQINVDIDSPNHKKSVLNSTTENKDFARSQDEDVFSKINVDESSNLKTYECNTIPEHCSTHKPLDSCHSSPSPKKIESTNECDNVPKSKTSPNTSHKLVTTEKPKRRLMPASSVLLRDISALDIEDEFEKPKGTRNGKKLAANEGKTTRGNITLLRLLRNNLRV